MNVTMMFTFSREDVEEMFPYKVLCETREGATWGTKKARDLFGSMFSKKEAADADRIFVQCHKWYLKSGVPEEVTMSSDTFVLWQKLAQFCSMV